jgi:hypothetical protein
MSQASLLPAAVSQRLREQSRVSELNRGRWAYKVDMSSGGVTRRLRQQSALRTACQHWGRFQVSVPDLPVASGMDPEIT